MGSFAQANGAIGHPDTPNPGSDPLWKPIDQLRPIKVICIGAGMSGILTGVRFPQRIPNLELTIYEKNEGIGGTWFENRYPGIACDVPCHSYQYTFASNTQWSHFYAPGAEILRYLKNVARRYDVMRYVKLRHRIQGATWNEARGKWAVKVENMATSGVFVDEADFLVSAVGMLNRWTMPDIPHLADFQGQLLHSANWKDWVQKFDATGKRIALIGGGSTGIQILPQIQPTAKHVAHFMKGNQWISPVGVGGAEAAKRGITGNFAYSEEELRAFRERPSLYHQHRHEVEGNMNEAQLVTFTGTKEQEEFWTLTNESMKTKLASKPSIYESLAPKWPPGCRRLTPGPGYLEALVQDNVTFIGCGIEKVLPNAIKSNDGQVHEVEVIICATGFDTTLKHTLPIVGLHGKALSDVWNPIPEAYLSMCPPSMPNFFLYQGPNGGPGAGSAVPFLEHQAEYMIKCIQKVQMQNIKSMVVSAQANAAFSKHIDEYFKKTVFSQTCRSWFKRGQEQGRVTALWPGSAIHAQVVFQNPRFEDFDYEYRKGGYSFAWLGNGLTEAQSEGGQSTTTYLDTVDIPHAIVEGVELWDPIDPYEEGDAAVNGDNVHNGPSKALSWSEEKLAEIISPMPV